MALPIISKQRKFLSKLLTFWIPLKSYRRAFRGIIQFGIKNYFNVKKNDKKTKFENELAIGAIMKDEGPYLKEWLDFHILVGVTKFYLYDNDSNDNTKEILKPYIKSGIVEYNWWPGKAMQMPAYQDIIQKHSYDTRWLALIDLDEFLVPVENDTVPEFLHTLPDGFAQLVVTWVIYGSSGHVHKPNGLVIENFKHHAEKTWGVKSIINPRLLVQYHSLHANFIAGWTIDNNGKKLGYINQTKNPPAYNKLRCNHYYTKSYDEYIARLNRGSATTQTTQSYRNAEKFIRKPLEHLIHQTYKNIEIIIVDDGSTDNCAKIVKDYAKHDKRIKLIQQKNAGVSAASNTGINAASGEYVCIHDHDDFVNFEYFEKMALAATLTDADVLCGEVNEPGWSFPEFKHIEIATSLDDKIFMTHANGSTDLRYAMS